MLTVSSLPPRRPSPCSPGPPFPLRYTPQPSLLKHPILDPVFQRKSFIPHHSLPEGPSFPPALAHFPVAATLAAIAPPLYHGCRLWLFWPLHDFCSAGCPGEKWFPSPDFRDSPHAPHVRALGSVQGIVGGGLCACPQHFPSLTYIHHLTRAVTRLSGATSEPREGERKSSQS